MTETRCGRNRLRVAATGFFALTVLLTACADGERGTDDSSLSPQRPLRPPEIWSTVGADRLGGSGELNQLAEGYIERYFSMFPSRATASGFYEHDAALEDLRPARLQQWLGFAKSTLGQIEAHVAQDCGSGSDQLACASARVDGDLLRREIELHLLDWDERAAPQTNPALWSQIASSSTVYLLVRADRRLEPRLGFVRDRLLQIPRLLKQARAALTKGNAAERTALHSTLAARQARSLAGFYRERLTTAAGLSEQNQTALANDLITAGATAADALERYAEFVDELAKDAKGSPVLGPELYARRFALYTGLDSTPTEVLASAEAALEEQLTEADEWALKLWPGLFGDEPPTDRRDRVRRLFLRLGDDGAQSIQEFVADYRDLVSQAEAFVKAHDVVSTADPLTLVTERSPSFFAGAAVGGVYSAGPYSPDSDTLLYLPTPPPSFDQQQTIGFFRDFNHHFNVMITPHELMPGHYLQLKWAALHPSRTRAMFSDAVTVEGWGTFAERLMLDLGWGDELSYAAHLKKRLENTARTIVDIRVHAFGMEQDEVERFVVEEALQEQQFARNMRRRTLTTAPQLVTYFLGNREIERVFQRFLAERGAERATELDYGVIREFTDVVMAMGPVPLSAWDELSRLMQSTPE